MSARLECSQHKPAEGAIIPDKERFNTSYKDDAPVLTEEDRKEVMALMRTRNISMDFIMEMKEAFQLFDKVSFTFLLNYYYIFL